MGHAHRPQSDGRGCLQGQWHGWKDLTEQTHWQTATHSLKTKLKKLKAFLPVN